MQALSTRTTTVLGRALPGVDAEKLMSTLDRLLGGRCRYALVGSTSLHLHAIEHPNLTQTLPLPNDLDVVFDHRSSLKLETSSEQELAEMNLKRDPNKPHVLYLSRENLPDLKIDLVKSSTPGFAKYYKEVQCIDDIPLGRLSDTIADYKSRLRDPEFIRESGGKKKLKAKSHRGYAILMLIRNGRPTPRTKPGNRWQKDSNLGIKLFAGSFH